MNVEFQDHSAEVREELDEKVFAALEAIGNQAVSHAKQNITRAVPRHQDGTSTGALRNSMNHFTVENEKSVYVGTNQEYAIYNEFGTGIYVEGGKGRQTPWRYQDAKGNWHTTRGITPIHFLKRAIQEHADEYKRIAKRILKGE